VLTEEGTGHGGNVCLSLGTNVGNEPKEKVGSGGVCLDFIFPLKRKKKSRKREGEGKRKRETREGREKKNCGGDTRGRGEKERKKNGRSFHRSATFRHWNASLKKTWQGKKPEKGSTEEFRQKGRF